MLGAMGWISGAQNISEEESLRQVFLYDYGGATLVKVDSHAGDGTLLLY